MITTDVKFRSEFKPLLSTLAVSFEFSKNLLRKSVRVIVEPGHVTVENGCSKYVYELEGLTLLPTSCRSLRWAGDRELQLTLQVKEKADSNGIVNNTSSPTNQDFLVSRIKSSQSHCHCVGCGLRIFKSQSHFRRVLPLPSENWSDFADIWFCHNHSHDPSDAAEPREGVSCSGDDGSVSETVSKLKRHPMLPRVEDCLVSSLYMLLDSSHVKAGCIAQTSGRLMCKRCGNFIGFVKDERNDGTEQSGVIYKIYHHAVSFTDLESNGLDQGDINTHSMPAIINCNETQQHVEDFLSGLLKDQSQIFTSFRFILTSSLQANGQSSISVLLWLLDQELSVFSSQLPSSNNPDKTHIKLSSSKYMKLLYKARFTTLGESSQRASLLKTSNIFEAWRIDNTVHGISLPYPLCKQLVQLLVTSTNSLTKSQRGLNGFHVGFLKVS